MSRLRPWASDPHARPRPYRFYPPKNNRIVTRVVKTTLLRDVRRKLKVADIEVVGDGIERLRSLRGERCLVTPSHSGGNEPHIVMYLSKLLNDDFNYVAAAELFEQSPLQRWVLQRLGVYSIIRGTVDRPSFTMTRKLLADGKRWLVIFPEGETIWQGSTVMPFQQGVFQLAFKAYEDACQTDKQASLFCIPIAIRYVYVREMNIEIDASLARLEARLALNEAGTCSSTYERMRRVAAAVLSAIEKTYRVKPGENSALGERIEILKLGVIARMESQLGIQPKEGSSLLDRTRALFNAVDRLACEEPTNSEYARQLTIESQKMAEVLYRDLWRLLRFVAIFDGYVGQSMTVENFMDVLGLMELEVFGKRPVWGPRRALVQVGDPVDLKGYYSSYAEDRRRTVGKLTVTMESAVREMLEQLGARDRPLN